MTWLSEYRLRVIKGIEEKEREKEVAMTAHNATLGDLQKETEEKGREKEVDWTTRYATLGKLTFKYRNNLYVAGILIGILVKLIYYTITIPLFIYICFTP